MDWNFGTFLWSMLVIFFWFAVIWMFIAVFADILRRDMSGWAKVGWIVLIVVLPLLGILIYLVTMPKGRTYTTAISYPAEQAGERGYFAVDAIAKAAQLQEEGKITAAEFERLKQQALGSPR